MSNNIDPDLIKVTEIFLVPSSFLVAALGTADTNPHRAAVSLLGSIISVMWWVCSREALSEAGVQRGEPILSPHPRRTRMLAWLAQVFIIGWFLSLIVHLLLWSRPLGAA